MRRRRGFTLVEMLVAFALVLFIMVILSEAFGASLRAFRDLKALGDLETQLRSATTLLRRDLGADHFEGRRRLSDPWKPLEVPREGFFRIAAPAATPNEGDDADSIPSRRVANHVLHFSAKLRGNERPEFFTARVPTNSPLLSGRTTFFDQPADVRYQEMPNAYHSQWAEVAYFLRRLPDETTGGVPLHALYRTQLVVLAANLDGSNRVFNLPPAAEADYLEMSCQPDAWLNRLYFNTPRDLVRTTYTFPAEPGRAAMTVARRTFDPANPTLRAATLLLTDVVSFDVQALVDGEYVDLAAFDTGNPNAYPHRPSVRAVKITLRVWHRKSEQARQLTLIQDL